MAPGASVDLSTFAHRVSVGIPQCPALCEAEGRRRIHGASGRVATGAPVCITTERLWICWARLPRNVLLSSAELQTALLSLLVIWMFIGTEVWL